MPNQWVKVINKDYGWIHGRALPVVPGSPKEVPETVATHPFGEPETVKFKNRTVFEVLLELVDMRKLAPNAPESYYQGIEYGISRGRVLCIERHAVELLGPDECRRLDDKFGLTGEEWRKYAPQDQHEPQG